MSLTKRVRVSRLDPAELLADDESRAEYLRMALDEEGIDGLLDALGLVARSKGLHAPAGAPLPAGDDPGIKAVASAAESLGLKFALRPIAAGA